MTSRPWAAIDTARLADTVVLPTPPLPPVTAITLTGREELSSAKASARSGESLESRMGGCSGEPARQRGFFACTPCTLELQGGANQPDPLQIRPVQFLRHALA